MNRRLFHRILAACLLTGALFGQDYKPLVGKWSMTSDTGSDSLNWTLVVKEAGGKVAAFLATDQGETPAKDVSFADGVLKLKASYEDQDYEIELKLKAGKLDGTWSGNGDSGKTSGTKM